MNNHQAPRPGLPRMRSRGRIAPAAPAPPPPETTRSSPRPRGYWPKRLLLASIVVAVGTWLGWDQVRARWPERALRVETTLLPLRIRLRGASGWVSGTWAHLRDERWPAWKGKAAAWWAGSPSTPELPPLPPPDPGATGIADAGRTPSPDLPGDRPPDAIPPAELPGSWDVEYGTAHSLAPPDAAAGSPADAPVAVETDRSGVAGAEGMILGLPDGTRLDLAPGCRYERENGGLRLLSGNALVAFPETGGALATSWGGRVEGAAAALEVYLDPDGGTVDALAGEVRVVTDLGEPVELLPMQRLDLASGDREPYPPAHAARFARRLAWFLAGHHGERARSLATRLAEDALASARDTPREPAAQRARRAASSW